MSRAEESLLNSKDDLLEKTEGIYARRTAAQRCWQAALRVLIMIPLVLSIVLFIVYFQDVAKPLDLLAGNTTNPQITENGEWKRNFRIFLHPEDHISREPDVLHLSWNFTKATIAPDGVEKSVYLINGKENSNRHYIYNVRNSQLMYETYDNRSIPRTHNRGTIWRYPEH